MNKKQQGNIGEAFAIYYFSRKGHTVSKPLSENTPYDLIVDVAGRLQRIQVKTTSYQRYKNGGYTVQLRTNGGNQSGKGKSTLIDAAFVDLVFVLCDDGSYYEIPAIYCEGKANMILSKDSEFYAGNASV